jgi:hypothetical protein
MGEFRWLPPELRDGRRLPGFNALFAGTEMAARMAASGGGEPQQVEDEHEAEIVSLTDVRSAPKQPAVAAG